MENKNINNKSGQRTLYVCQQACAAHLDSLVRNALSSDEPDKTMMSATKTNLKKEYTEIPSRLLCRNMYIE
jgi:hypothetical protein